MKVIQNNYKTEYPKQIICTRCESKLEYDKQDIQTLIIPMSDQRQGKWEKTKNFLNCPCCKDKIFL